MSTNCSPHCMVKERGLVRRRRWRQVKCWWGSDVVERAVILLPPLITCNIDGFISVNVLDGVVDKREDVELYIPPPSTRRTRDKNSIDVVTVTNIIRNLHPLSSAQNVEHIAVNDLDYASLLNLYHRHVVLSLTQCRLWENLSLPLPWWSYSCEVECGGGHCFLQVLLRWQEEVAAHFECWPCHNCRTRKNIVVGVDQMTCFEWWSVCLFCTLIQQLIV
jgi:hypothetical protein